MIENFNRTIDHWITALEQYSFIELCTKPSPTQWSLGQLYNHLIEDANFYIQQIRICVTTNDHATEQASPHGATMLSYNEFPNEMIEGDPANTFIPQPESRKQLLLDLLLLKTEMNEAANLIAKSAFRGKTKHPGLNYFSAVEWLQFADMHFRHHLRQKKRLDDFLTTF